jgi:hypothetical protein
VIVDQYLADEVACQCGRISRQLGSAQPSKGPDVLDRVFLFSRPRQPQLVALSGRVALTRVPRPWAPGSTES